MPSPLDGFFGTTTAETLPPPYKNFAANPQSVQTGAQTVFPPYSTDPNNPNSLVSVAGAPQDFNLSPSQLPPSVFEGWASEYQVEYLTANGGGSAGSPNIVTIGGGTDAHGNPIPTIHAMISDGAATGGIPTAYVLENLSGKDFAAMSASDQNVLFQAYQGNGVTSDVQAAVQNVVNGLGLSPFSPQGSATTTQTALDAAIDADIAQINADPALPDNGSGIFIAELNNIKTRLKNEGPFISADQTNSAIKAIMDRYQTVSSFAKLPQPGDTVDVSGPSQPNNQGNVTVTGQKVDPLSTNVNSLPGASPSIDDTVSAMIQAERQILSADNAMLAATGLPTNPPNSPPPLSHALDAPDLLAAYMENAALKDQEINSFDTQKISQLNNLIDMYNNMEDLINQTLQKFSDKNDTSSKNLLDAPDFTTLWNSLNPDQRAALSAFLQVNVTVTNPNYQSQVDAIENDPSLSPLQKSAAISQIPKTITQEVNLDSTPNPLETANNVTRPTFPILEIDETQNPPAFKLDGQSQTQWNDFLTRLSDSTTQLNQASQLAFSTVNSREQELSTFDNSASSALSGALTLIQNIGQNMVIS